MQIVDWHDSNIVFTECQNHDFFTATSKDKQKCLPCWLIDILFFTGPAGRRERSLMRQDWWLKTLQNFELDNSEIKFTLSLAKATTSQLINVIGNVEKQFIGHEMTYCPKSLFRLPILLKGIWKPCTQNGHSNLRIGHFEHFWTRDEKWIFIEDIFLSGILANEAKTWSQVKFEMDSMTNLKYICGKMMRPHLFKLASNLCWNVIKH